MPGWHPAGGDGFALGPFGRSVPPARPDAPDPAGPGTAALPCPAVRLPVASTSAGQERTRRPPAPTPAAPPASAARGATPWLVTAVVTAAPSTTGRTIARTALAGAVAGAPLLAPPPPPTPPPTPRGTSSPSARAAATGPSTPATATSGGLQFTPRTWTAFGGDEFAATANKASREEQIVVAERVLAEQGWGAWPACSRKLGRPRRARHRAQRPAAQPRPRSAAPGPERTRPTRRLRRQARRHALHDRRANGVAGGWQAGGEEPRPRREPEPARLGQPSPSERSPSTRRRLRRHRAHRSGTAAYLEAMIDGDVRALSGVKACLNPAEGPRVPVRRGLVAAQEPPVPRQLLRGVDDRRRRRCRRTPPAPAPGCPAR